MKMEEYALAIYHYIIWGTPVHDSRIFFLNIYTKQSRLLVTEKCYPYIYVYRNIFHNLTLVYFCSVFLGLCIQVCTTPPILLLVHSYIKYVTLRYWQKQKETKCRNFVVENLQRKIKLNILQLKTYKILSGWY